MRSADYIPRPSRRYDGRGVVQLNGKNHYLGRAGEWPAKSKSPPPTINAEYQALISRWLANGRSFPNESDDPTVNDVMLAYLRHAEVYYHREGQKSTHLGSLRDALRVVKATCGRTPAREFGPRKLKAIQQAMAVKGWCRSYLNSQVDRVRRMFKWAVGEEMVPGDLYHALQAVPGLKQGTPGVRESDPVRPVPAEVVEATLPFLPPPIRAMVEIQLLTAMRPGEVCLMRAGDIEMSGQVWTYRPHQHKSKHRGKGREVPIGPRAREILLPWLPEDTRAYLFCPAAAEEARNAARREGRRTAMTPSQRRRKRVAAPKRPKRAAYDETAFRNAVYRACDKAFPPPAPLSPREGESKRDRDRRLTDRQREELARWVSDHRWHPNRLRHAAATALRKEHGLETARVVLGHCRASTTEIYAELDHGKAKDAMAKSG